ncbi:ROK family protein [Paenibacillus sp. FSL R10-2734]|uniref:ROK family protein n=1 Tax=Paenibacillus sp. FSL R10-2734 TaxID=2954691 RepID=UPI0030DC51E4
METKFVIALDVGGTFIKSSLVMNGCSIQASQFQVPSLAAEDASTTLQQFMTIMQYQYMFGTTLLNDLSAAEWHIGIAFPGPFDYEQGISYIQGLCKFESLYGMNLKKVFRSLLEANNDKSWAAALVHAPIRFENDAKLFALGVSTLFPQERFISLTLGTGLGSAFIDQGKIRIEGEGVPRNGELYDKPYRHTMIDEVFSRRGILHAAQERGLLIEGMEVKELADLARQGNLAYQQVFEQFGSCLAEMLDPYIVGFGAQRLVLGGQIAKSFDVFGPALEQGLLPHHLSIYTSEHVIENTFKGIDQLFS